MIELRKIAFRRPVKLLTLLLTSMLIATTSAAVYYSMSTHPTVTISQAKVIFEQGGDWPTGSSLGTNSTYVGLAIKAYPNATLTYDQPVNISNTDSSAHEVRLMPTILTEWWVLPTMGVIIAAICIVALLAHTRRLTPPPPPLPEPHNPTCAMCGQPLTFVPQYQRWYCQNCKNYI